MKDVPAAIGPYVIERELGRGGMGAVFLARHRELGRRVALKVLAMGSGSSGATELDTGSAEWVARFQREARAAAQLANHPGIVGVHDTGEVDGLSWLAMQYIEGESLEAMVDEGDMSPATVAAIGVQVAEALHHAHGAGLIHRDVKPANIMIEANSGDAKLADFGLVRAQQLDGAAARLTQTGEVLGTVGYLPPEQCLGEGIDARTDVYALGVTLYECVSGLQPFGGGSAAVVLNRSLRDPPPPLRRVAPQVPRDLETVIMKCLEKRPQDRYASAAELAAELARVRDGEPILTIRPSLPTRIGRWGRRRPLAAAGLGLLVLGAGGGPPLAIWWSGRAEAKQTAVTEKTGERQLIELAHEVSAAYDALATQTGADLKRLENSLHGVDLTPEERAATVQRILAVADRVAAAHPNTQLPRAWRGLALCFAERGDEGLKELRAAERDADANDPFPRLIRLRLRLWGYAGNVELPAAKLTGTGVKTGVFVEGADEKRWREAIAAGTEELEGLPIWPHLRQAGAYLALAEAARALGDQRYDEVATAVTTILDDPFLEADARTLSATALYLEGSYVESAREWRRIADLGRKIGVVRGATAALTAAYELEFRGEDPDAMLTLVEELGARLQTDDEWKAVGSHELGVAAVVRGRVAAARGEDPSPHWAAARTHLDASIALDREAEVLRDRAGLSEYEAQVIRGAGGDARAKLNDALADYSAAIAAGGDTAALQVARADAWLRLGRTEMRYGELERSHHALTQGRFDLDAALKARPDDAYAWNNRAAVHGFLSELARQRGEDTEPHDRASEADYTEAIARADGWPDPLFNRGDYYGARAESAMWDDGVDPEPWCVKALADFDAALHLRPGDLSYRTGRAEVLQLRGEWASEHGGDFEAPYDEALRELGAVIDEAADPTEPLMARARALQNLGGCRSSTDTGDARAAYVAGIADCTAVLQRHPGHGPALHRRALLWKFAGSTLVLAGEDPGKDFDQAVADATAAVKSRPFSAEWVEVKAHICLNAADVAAQRGEDFRPMFLRALEELRRLTELRPDSIDDHHQYAASSMQIAQLDHQAGRNAFAAFKRAERAYSGCLTVKPESAEFRLARAAVRAVLFPMARLNDEPSQTWREGALEDWRHVRERDPGEVEGYLGPARMHVGLRSFDDARALVAAGLKVNPGSPALRSYALHIESKQREAEAGGEKK